MQKPEDDKDAEGLFAGRQAEGAGKIKPRKTKNLLNIDLNFNVDPEPRFERSERGRGGRK